LSFEPNSSRMARFAPSPFGIRRGIIRVVTAGRLEKRGCDIGEEFLGGVRRHKVSGGLAAECRVSALARAVNHLLDERLGGLAR